MKLWIQGARLRTLPLAVAPIILAASLAYAVKSFSLPLTLLALTVALFLQIGVNYANDYSDGIRGTDENRVGPLRLTASGKVPAHRVKNAAFLCFACAACAGAAAIFISGKWIFFLFGFFSILAAWFYTGGKHPYGYAGFGEIVVFLFFGILATWGTYYLQSDVQSQEIWFLATGMGLFAVAVLLANNIRDIPTDAASGKRTLAVRIGASYSRLLYTLCVLVPIAISLLLALIYSLAILSALVLFLVVPAILILYTAKTPREHILVLQLTSYASLTYAVTVALGFIFV